MRLPFPKLRIRLTIPKKILTGSSIIILMVLVVSIFSISTIYKLNQISKGVAFRSETIRSQGKRLQELVLSMQESEKKFVLLKKEEYRDVFMESAIEFSATLKGLQDVIEDPGVADEIRRSGGFFETYRYIVENALSQGGEEATKKLASISDLTEDVADGIISGIDQALAMNEESIDASLSKLEARGAAAGNLAVVICSLSIVVGTLSYFYLRRTITKPVQLLEKATRHVSKGEFDHQVEINTQDEFGNLARSFNEMGERLKELDELKSDFISLVSHELRTPLSVMREAVSLLKDGILGEIGDKQREFLTIISQEVERMIVFVNELLDLSRLEAGRLPIEKLPLDIKEVIERNLNKVKPLLFDKKIEAELAISPHLPRVLADGVRVDQVLTNLIDNAIKFTPSGGKICIIADLAGDKAGEDGKHSRGSRDKQKYVRVTVWDNGEGIGDEEKRYVFDKFYQARTNKGGKAKGSGLGLSITKRIVEAHGGNIWFTSTTGEGSYFHFTLPTEN